jgi:hypothetical protein
LLAIRGFTDDFQITLSGDDGGHALPDDMMVIREHNPDGGRFDLCRGSGLALLPAIFNGH